MRRKTALTISQLPMQVFRISGLRRQGRGDSQFVAVYITGADEYRFLDDSPELLIRLVIVVYSSSHFLAQGEPI